MIKSLVIGSLFPLMIILSGWLRVLLSSISMSLGNGIPFLFFFLGISFGFGDVFIDKTPFWPGFILGMLLSVLITFWSNKEDAKKSYNTVSICASGFIIGGLIGFIFGLFLN